MYRITYNLNDNNNELVKRILNSFQITRWLQHKVYRIERRNNRLHIISFCHHIVSISASYFFNGFLVLSEKSCSWILGNIKCISNSTAIEFVADLHRFVLLFWCQYICIGYWHGSHSNFVITSIFLVLNSPDRVFINSLLVMFTRSSGKRDVSLHGSPILVGASIFIFELLFTSLVAA